MTQVDISREYAEERDRNDPLREFRNRFFIPEGIIYMDGNSLGLLSRDTEKAIQRVLGEWRSLAVSGWLKGKQPWFTFAETLGQKAASLVGARPDEVIATGTTTLNIHSLISTFFKPEGRRNKILADELNFPSDIYALKSHLKLKGLNPETHLVLTPSEDGKILSEDRICELMSEEIAVAMLPSVLYRSGQLLDMQRLTRKAHQKGIIMGFDCSHSAGAVPHEFNTWDVDFALWCSYKYMNAGPGNLAFLYINQKHFHREPGIAGWFGFQKDRLFDMLLEFEHQKSAGGWQISSPGIIGCAALKGALSITLEAGIQNIRKKSVQLTSYLIELIGQILEDSPYNFSVASPRDPDRRGGHVAIERLEEARRICEALKIRNVIPDFRPPNIIRIAPVALYNTFAEVWTVVQQIKEIIDYREYEQTPEEGDLII